jgi:hypothetical protein
VLLSVPGSHLVDRLDSLLCLWFFHRVIESGGNLLPFGSLSKGPAQAVGDEFCPDRESDYVYGTVAVHSVRRQ